jgi:hypothetical protein
MSTKLNTLSDDLRKVDHTFSKWSKKLNKYANTIKCHESLMMEFLSRYSTEVVKTFFSFTKLSEHQDLVNQLVKMNKEKLIGLSHLPKFVSAPNCLRIQKAQYQ